MSGEVEIIFDNGLDSFVIDTLGRGSWMSAYTIIKEETYSYSARACSPQGTTLLAINLDILDKMRT